MPIIDAQVARTLLQSAAAVRMLGAESIMVGLRPELAQTIVGLGINLSGIVTHVDLQSGVEYALQRQRRGSLGHTARLAAVSSRN